MIRIVIAVIVIFLSMELTSLFAGDSFGPAERVYIALPTIIMGVFIMNEIRRSNSSQNK